MNFSFPQFNRKFSASMYKNLSIKLGEMNFFKDFVNDTRGDLYPVRKKSIDCTEYVKNNQYILENGNISRMICQFFPFATYKITFSATDAEVGFIFKLATAEAFVSMKDHIISFTCENHGETIEIPTALLHNENSLIISCRPGAFDIYLDVNGKPEFQRTIYEEKFRESNQESVFSNSYAFLFASGSTTIKEVVSYIDNGVSIADIRPVKYENGDVIQENGKIYFTASIRMQEGTFQGVFSWIPGTAEFDLTGTVFYDCGDGKWRNYVAPTILYDRNQKEWLVWVSSFEHKHILAYASLKGDPRFGVNLIDIKFMESASDTSSISEFLGFKGDEDPDLLYDEKNNRWLLAICRINPETRSYGYVFFESDNPFKNFRYIGCGYEGAETGGSFVKMNGELFFVCGNDFKKVSEYRICSGSGMETAKFNYPDGGFRGWGSVFPVKSGSRTRYFWLTFDRHNGSDYNWSYGNLYCFEMTV